MNSSSRVASQLPHLVAACAAAFWCGCGPTETGSTTGSPNGGGAGSSGAPGGGATSVAGMSSSAGAASTSGGGAGTLGLGGTAAAGASGTALGGAPSAGTSGANSGGVGHSGGGAENAGAGSGGMAGGVGGASGAGGGAPSGCSLPATVSFKTDIQKFLIPSCSGTGCHVIDGSSTMSAGGYDHAYDWITATSHASSCPSGAPKRFEVVIAVINAANPPSCSKSRKMPPDPATHAPLTPCQIATLQAWLDEPLVTQTHRADDTSPTTPYAMPPFN